ncbi:XRE family transcriptional regulator [Chloroflexia bacterium SDU3-3]|nr:XRE family transcriptional regulator [Chloroflexia bacterium SDU3-3]
MLEMRSFGTLLRQCRAARDLTQESLSELVGCSPQTLRAFESGRRRPSREMATRLAAALELPQAERGEFVQLARARAPLALADAGAPLPALALPDPAAARPAAPADALIGRGEDLARLESALLHERRRLVTLLGPGGIGKTRLALHAVASLPPSAFDMVAFVALAPVAHASMLVTTIAEAVGCVIAPAQNPEQALLAFLRERATLLVLDNLEHLLVQSQSTAVLALLAAILREAPLAQLLITSRERLRQRDEWVIELTGLALPADERARSIERSAAVALFVERARQIKSDFKLSPANRRAVAQICRMLGGAPLGVELAASWAHVLSCDEIAAEIRHGADMESISDRSLPDRHRSLHAVIDHSWQLLGPDEQLVLLSLSLFRGGAGRDAIAAVLGPEPGGGERPQRALLPLLAALVDKSLLRRQSDATGATRYDLHELVAQYASARLAGQPDVAAAAAERHARFYAGWLAGQDAALKSGEQQRAAQVIIIEMENIRAAWAWACQHGDAHALRQMFFPLDWLYELRGWNAEGEAAFARASAHLHGPVLAGVASESTQICYWLLVAREGWHALRRDPAYAERQMRQAAAAMRGLDPLRGLMHIIKGLAYLQIFAGDYADAEVLLAEALLLARQAGDAWAASVALVVRGVLETLRTDAATARPHLQAALAAARAVGDPRHVTLTLNYLGLSAFGLGQCDEAERACRECLTLAAAHHDRFQMCLALQTLGRVARQRGELSESAWLLGESLSIAREIGDRWLEAQALGHMADLAEAQGNPRQARQHYRAALAVSAAAPLPIALDLLVALAEFELAAQPAAALAALWYAQRHPRVRPQARRRAMVHTDAAPPSPAALALADTFSPDQPAALLALFSA